MVQLANWRNRMAATLFCVVAAPSFGQAAPEAISGANPHPFGPVGSPHVLPMRPPEYFKVPRVAPLATTAKLVYYGGRVASNMQVVQVLWGTGSYLPEVAGSVSPNVGTFYQQALNSSYIDWLSEYNTVGLPAPTSSQIIGRGSFLGHFVIAPSVTGSTISDTSIQTELKAQIAGGHLPAPTLDANGNSNTYYAIFFPPGKTITQGGSSSCVSGGFCAYHGTIAAHSPLSEILYGVHPDMQSGSGCFTGCGGSSSVFANQTSVASHEMVETITDAEVGIATVVGPPLAWYDTTQGEIGDICNAQQGTFIGSDSIVYTVQKEWSNALASCIVGNANVGGSDFSLGVAPTTVTIKANTSATTGVALADLGTAPVSVALSASGLPRAVTASFNPSTVTVTTAGGSSTLTLKAGRRVTKGNYTVTITGSAGSTKHSTTLLVTVQ